MAATQESKEQIVMSTITTEILYKSARESLYCIRFSGDQGCQEGCPRVISNKKRDADILARKNNFNAAMPQRLAGKDKQRATEPGPIKSNDHWQFWPRVNSCAYGSELLSQWVI
jgi:hypothetical protein